MKKTRNGMQGYLNAALIIKRIRSRQLVQRNAHKCESSSQVTNVKQCERKRKEKEVEILWRWKQLNDDGGLAQMLL